MCTQCSVLSRFERAGRIERKEEEELKNMLKKGEFDERTEPQNLNFSVRAIWLCLDFKDSKSCVEAGENGKI